MVWKVRDVVLQKSQEVETLVLKEKTIQKKVDSKPKPKPNVPKIVKSIWIDKTKIFPCVSSTKSRISPGPKQVWVPKSV